MTYRKNTPPPKRLTGWPHEDRRSVDTTRRDSIDVEIERLRALRATNDRVDEIVRAVVLVTFLVGCFVVGVLLWERDQAEQRRCVDRGGIVQRVRGSYDGGWVCVLTP